jgi:hypothetical protein
VAGAQPPGHLRDILTVLNVSMVSLEPSTAANEIAPRHRADYILERGLWRVSCRVCGWKAVDADRRRLASRFRFHLQVAPGESPSADRQRPKVPPR